MSGPSIYDLHAPQLLARGFFPLSIGPGTKKPQHFVPSLNQYHDTTGWTHPARRPETSPQPGAGIGVRLGKQADGTYVVALDWDDDEAATIAMNVWPPTVTKEGQRGFTAFYRSSKPIPCAFRKSFPNVMVVQAGQDWDSYNDPSPLHCPT